MGVDLTLLPFFGEGIHITFSHDVLLLERRRELWEPIAAIEGLKGKDVPEGFTSYLGHEEGVDDSCYGDTTQSPYNTPVKYVKVRELLPLAEHPAVLDAYRNRAIWAYLKECPPDLKVALYWH